MNEITAPLASSNHLSSVALTTQSFFRVNDLLTNVQSLDRFVQHVGYHLRATKPEAQKQHRAAVSVEIASLLLKHICEHKTSNRFGDENVTRFKPHGWTADDLSCLASMARLLNYVSCYTSPDLLDRVGTLSNKNDLYDKYKELMENLWNLANKYDRTHNKDKKPNKAHILTTLEMTFRNDLIIKLTPGNDASPFMKEVQTIWYPEISGDKIKTRDRKNPVVENPTPHSRPTSTTNQPLITHQDPVSAPSLQAPFLLSREEWKINNGPCLTALTSTDQNEHDYDWLLQGNFDDFNPEQDASEDNNSQSYQTQIPSVGQLLSQIWVSSIFVKLFISLNYHKCIRSG